MAMDPKGTKTQTSDALKLYEPRVPEPETAFETMKPLDPWEQLGSEALAGPSLRWAPKVLNPQPQAG